MFALDSKGGDVAGLHLLLRLLFVVFATASFVLIPILLPINYWHSSRALPTRASGLDKFSCLNIPTTDTSRFWAHLAMEIIFVGWTCWWIRRETLNFIDHHDRYNPSMDAHCRYILTDYPDSWSNQDLFNFLRQYEVGDLSVQVVRDMGLNRMKKRLLTQVEAVEVGAVSYSEGMLKIYPLLYE